MVTTFTATEQGPDYARLLKYAADDFSRGADRDDPKWIKGQPFFTKRSHGISAAQVRGSCAQDPAFFRVMINPYDGERIMSREFVREFMGRIDRVIGCRLLWIAAVHSKATAAHASNRHAHIIIRSRTFGDGDIRFDRTFATFGFRWVAAKLIAEKLGPMTAEELTMADALSAEIDYNQRVKKWTEVGMPEWAASLLEKGT